MGLGNEIARLMARQNGVIGRGQALQLGASGSYIKTKLRNGEWISLANGVYASVSSPPNWERQLRAALLDHPIA